MALASDLIDENARLREALNEIATRLIKIRGDDPRKLLIAHFDMPAYGISKAFGAAFPLEGAAWVVSTLDPALYSAPSFLTTTSERTMAAYASGWAASITAACGSEAGGRAGGA